MDDMDSGADEGEHGGRVIPNSTWIVDYAGDGKYCVRRIAQDGSFDQWVDVKLDGFLSHQYPELGVSAHVQVYALPGDTVVFAPAFALIRSLRLRAGMQEILNRSPARVPRRKHFPMPMRRAEDGVGIVKGSMHADQGSAFESAIAVNGFNLGLVGCNCAGTKRRWEWVEPKGLEGRDDGSGAAGEN